MYLMEEAVDEIALDPGPLLASTSQKNQVDICGNFQDLWYISLFSMKCCTCGDKTAVWRSAEEATWGTKRTQIM